MIYVIWKFDTSLLLMSYRSYNILDEKSICFWECSAIHLFLFLENESLKEE